MSGGHLAAQLFNPERLTLAREFRGLTKTALARRVDKTPSALTQFEMGQVRPDGSTLSALALALGFPVQFFAREGSRLVIPLDSCSFRSLRSASQRDRRRLLASGSMVRELVAFLEQYVDFPPDAVSPLSGLADTDIESCAAEVRRQWGLSSGPIPNMVKLLESRGVIVAPIQANCASVDAFSFWFEGRALVMLVLDKKSPSRSRFDAAHELGHLVLHNDASPGDPVLEREADRFAAAFLLPAAAYARECPTRLDWPCLRELKKRWRVSLAALVRRGRDLGRLSDASYRRAFTYLNATGERKNERDEPPREHPVLLSQALEVIRDDWSLKDLSGELRFPVQEILSDILDEAETTATQAEEQREDD